MPINWIKSPLLPACLPTLSTRHFRRYGAKREGLAIKKVPSECFHEQNYTTFLDDAVGEHILTWWGRQQLLVVNDFPHGNSIWPNSPQAVARDRGAALQHASAESGSIAGRQQRHIASRYRRSPRQTL